jgi:predicted DNA-binding transcriptional regulator AlpA
MSNPSLMSIQTFVADYGISRSSLYRLWQEGAGPKITRVRSRTLISSEAATEWRRRVEAESRQPGTKSGTKSQLQ